MTGPEHASRLVAETAKMIAHQLIEDGVAKRSVADMLRRCAAAPGGEHEPALDALISSLFVEVADEVEGVILNG